MLIQCFIEDLEYMYKNPYFYRIYRRAVFIHLQIDQRVVHAAKDSLHFRFRCYKLDDNASISKYLTKSERQ